MKKIILNICLLLFTSFLFSGCVSIYTVNNTYGKEFINYDLKTIIEKSEKKVNIIHTDSESKIEPSGFVGTAYANHFDKDFNSNILKVFFEQYFKDVAISNEFNKENDINFQAKFKLNNYNYNYGLMVNLDANISIKAYYKNKLILEKEYKIKESSDTKMIFGWSNSQIPELYKEVMHKTFLKIYEKHIKPDLLKALEENQ